MRPVQTYYRKGTPWEIEYLDDIAVAPGIYECKASDLELWRYSGSQKEGKFAISRPLSPQLQPNGNYFYRDMIIISLKLHRMISLSPDMDNWKLIESPPLATFLMGSK